MFAERSPQRAIDDTPPPLNATAFREALGRFASGVTVMTTIDECAAPYGVTATSFASLSLDPPLVQWSLRNAAYSLPVFLQARRFAVNVLSAGQEAVSSNFATPEIDRFAGLQTEPGLGGVSLIKGALAWIECSLESTLAGGDHTILVGNVLRVRTFDRQPLLYWRGGYLPDSADQTESDPGT